MPHAKVSHINGYGFQPNMFVPFIKKRAANFSCPFFVDSFPVYASK